MRSADPIKRLAALLSKPETKNVRQVERVGGSPRPNAARSSGAITVNSQKGFGPICRHRDWKVRREQKPIVVLPGTPPEDNPVLEINSRESVRPVIDLS